MDIIFISELRIETLIGIYEMEKRVPQTIVLDLEVGLPGKHASASDRIEDTIDYSQIVTHIRLLFQQTHFSLLEHAAESIAEMVQRDFKAPWIRISIAKLAPLKGVKRLGVMIERGSRN
ncbi:MAG: dihydroneopterin aldolase [Pseudomonadota bacterium]